MNLFLINRKTKKVDNMYRIESNSILKVPLIFEYLEKFNLKTKKKYSYLKWKQVYEMILNKEHITENGLYNIKILSKQVNLITSITKKTGSK